MAHALRASLTFPDSSTDKEYMEMQWGADRQGPALLHAHPGDQPHQTVTLMASKRKISANCSNRHGKKVGKLTKYCAAQKLLCMHALSEGRTAKNGKAAKYVSTPSAREELQVL